jgi:flavin-dependent dehydrogenase
MHYTATVNSFRDQLAARCKTVIARATAITTSDDIQTVETEAGHFRARLVIVAAGGKDNLLTPLGIYRRNHPSLSSMSFAFHIKPDDIDRFDFSGFNYFPAQAVDDIDYVTIFRIGDIMRVNLFSQISMQSSLLRDIKNAPREHMQRYFPLLEDYIGSYTVATKVQSFPTTFYRLHGTACPGVVAIGDDYQSVNPTTGTGISKCTTDVDRLCNEYIPAWLATPGMGSRKIAAYYRDPVKRAVDDDSLERWISYRDSHRGFWGKQLSRVELRYKAYLDLW